MSGEVKAVAEQFIDLVDAAVREIARTAGQRVANEYRPRTAEDMFDNGGSKEWQQLVALFFKRFRPDLRIDDYVIWPEMHLSALFGNAWYVVARTGLRSASSDIELSTHELRAAPTWLDAHALAWRRALDAVRLCVAQLAPSPPAGHWRKYGRR